MNPALWRAVALTCIAIAVAFVLYQPTLPDREDFGITFRVPHEDPGKVLVTSVTADSPAARAGIRSGDLLSYGTSAVDRARVVYVTPGSKVHLIANGTRRVTLTARNTRRANIPWISMGTRLAFLVVAALLAWRRPQDLATRSLVTFLVCYGVAISMANGVLPDPVLSLIVFQLVNAALFITGTAALAWFAAHFPTGIAQTTPRRLSVLTLFLAGLVIVIMALAQWVPRSATAISLLNAGFRLTFLALCALVLITLITSYVQ